MVGLEDWCYATSLPDLMLDEDTVACLLAEGLEYLETSRCQDAFGGGTGAPRPWIFPGQYLCPLCRMVYYPLASWTREKCPECVLKPDYKIPTEKHLKFLEMLEGINQQQIIKGREIVKQMRLEKNKEEQRRIAREEAWTPEQREAIDRYDNLSDKARKALNLKNPRHLFRKRSKQEIVEIDEVYAVKASTTEGFVQLVHEGKVWQQQGQLRDSQTSEVVSEGNAKLREMGRKMQKQILEAGPSLDRDVPF